MLATIGSLALMLFAAGGAGASPVSASKAGPEATDLAPHLSGQIIVGFKRTTSESDRSEIAEQLAGARVEALDPEVAGIEVVRTAPEQSVSKAIKAFEAAPEVRYAEPDYLLTSAVTPNEGSNYWRAWQHRNYGQTLSTIDGGSITGIVDADQDTEEAWDQETGSADVIVGVVDSGIAFSHPDLDGNIWTNPGESGSGRESNGIDDDGNGYIDDYRGWSVARNSNDASDPQGHGSEVAGLIGAEANNGIGTAGVAWDVSLLASQWTTTGSGTSSAAIAALEYAAANHPQVINASFSGGGTKAMRDAIAAHPEILYVAAAGNDALDEDFVRHEPCTVPGTNVICVAASTPRDELASFSDYGATSVDLAAPGTSLLTTGPSGYVLGDGTSFAAPQVSGAAALIYSEYPNARTWWVRERILSTVEQKPAFAGKVATGGRLNVAGAVAPTGDTTAPQTTITARPDPVISTDATAAFTYSASEIADFECRLDAGPWRSCPAAGISYSGLALGSHDFSVRATDGPGNVESAPPSSSFTVAAIPQTAITSRPDARTRSTDASFTYSSDNPAASFECRVDGDAWQGCPASGRSYSDLVEGTHTFRVRATVAGFTDQSPATASWEIDLSAPNVTITSTPPAAANTRSASFGYTADDLQATFRCQLDGGGWESCPKGGKTYGGLADGEHVFELTAADQLGNESDPVSYRWIVDARVPETILGVPAISGRDASFTYSSDGAGDEFECRLDGAGAGGWQGCPTEGKGYAGLADGTYSFNVRARAANGNLDPSPANYTWTVAEDPPPPPAPPDTSISAGPGELSNRTVARFEFTGTNTTDGFQCQLDAGGWYDCTSPLTISGLPDGGHDLSVRAYDAERRVDPSPALYSWSQDTLAPTTTITRHPQGRLRAGRTARFRYRASERGSSFQCRLDSGPWRRCPPSGKSYRPKAGRHVFAVRAIDRAKNRDRAGAEAVFRVSGRSRHGQR